MRTVPMVLAAVSFLGIAGAADAPPGYSFDILVNLNDARTVRLAATVPDETRHTLQVAEGLRLELRTWQLPPEEGREHLSSVVLVEEAGGQRRERRSQTSTRKPGEPLAVAFSVCGERTIMVAEGEMRPGRCADLPPLSTPDPILGKCGDCAGPYEGMPATLANRARIAPESEPGEPLRVTGRVIAPDGRPRAGVIVYAYQTDRGGIYPPPSPPRAESHHQGRLRGWVRTGADGRYVFDTIRPGSYPNTTNPQHIHMHVIEPGCATYFVDELLFTDDPMFDRLSDEDRKWLMPGMGGSAVVTPRRRGGLLEVTRDIHLGKNIPGHPGCPAPRGG